MFGCRSRCKHVTADVVLAEEAAAAVAVAVAPAAPAAAAAAVAVFDVYGAPLLQ